MTGLGGIKLRKEDGVNLGYVNRPIMNLSLGIRWRIEKAEDLLDLLFCVNVDTEQLLEISVATNPY